MRKRKRHQPSRRSRLNSPWLLIPLGALVLVLIAGALLARDLQRVRASLNAAQASLAEVREAAGNIEMEAAAAALDRADDDLAEARSRSGGPLWSIGAHLPVLGDSIVVTQEVVATASALVAVADRAVTDGGRLLGDGLDISVDDGRVDLAPLDEARALLDDLPLQRLADARDRLAAAEPRWAPQELLEGRADTLAVASEAITSLERGRALLSALPSFLGEEGPRSYFLGVQTPAELRGTGGMIGYFAVLNVDAGRFELGSSDVYEAPREAGGSATGYVGELTTLGESDDGVPVSDEFSERYGHVGANALFHNVNVDPHLPTTAEVALDLYEHRTGERLDGVILVDPVALELLLTAIGQPLGLPAEAVAAGLPDTLAPEDVTEFATIEVYDRLGRERTAERRLVLRGLGDEAFATVFGGSWDGVAVSRAIGAAVSERHIQVYSADDEEQAAFSRVGVAGELGAPEGADLLSVTANNAVVGKQDVHLGHRVIAAVALDDPRRNDEGQASVERRTDLRVEVDNPLPTEGMDEYIIGNCVVGSEQNSACSEGPPGVNRTWFTAWAPGDARLASPSDGQALSGVRATEFRGLAAFDRYLETPSQDVAGFDLAWEGRAPASTDADDLVYELTWWSQAKAIPTLLDVTVTAPEGWRIEEVEVSGGGSGTGLGAFGEGQPLTAEVDGDGRAHLTGTVTADTQLRVRMVGDDVEP